MHAKIKPLAEQVIVVTGASSGLGLAIAKKAAQAGASLLLTSTDEPAVRKLAEEINAAGGRAHAVAGELADGDACAKVARAAIARFGGFDTWITAGGDEAACSNGAREAAAQLKAGARRGVLVHISERALGSEIRRALKTYGRAVTLSQVSLPRGLTSFDGAATAALYAALDPMGQIALTNRGKLSGATLARKHQGLILGAGALALAGIAIWVGRRRIATAARPHVARAVRPLILEAARRRPLQAVTFAAKHPHQVMNLARALR